MFEIVQAGGWLMVPILMCSLVAAAIAIERAWALRRGRVLPRELAERMSGRWEPGAFAARDSDALQADRPLGQVLAAGLAHADRGREFMKEAMLEAVDQANHDLQRYLTALGIVASISPLLGLLGTVVGMIEVFTALMLEGSGNARALAGGIAEALITTAAGLSVAIPALMFHRYYLRRVDDLTFDLEQRAASFIERLHGEPG